MKKRVITGLMTALVIGSLAGCGAGQKETVESTAPATMTETVAASQVETAEVTETETTVQEDRASRIKAYQAALDNIYQNYERYEYNDQDVMNEMYYDNLVYVGWDEYNCPPVWCYLNKEKIEQGVLEFADYNEMRELAKNPERMLQKYQNVTRQIYENAKIIHYLGNTKPWSTTREQSRLYEMFDEAYETMVYEMREKGYTY